MKQHTLSWLLVAWVAPLLAEAQPASVHVQATSTAPVREPPRSA
jgi:hypothetical protein